MSITVFKACTLLSPCAVRGTLSLGLLIACSISSNPVRMMSSVDAIGIDTFVGNHVSVSQVRIRCVSHINTKWHLYASNAGPTYQPSMAWGDHVSRLSGFSCTNTRMPGGAIGVRL